MAVANWSSSSAAVVKAVLLPLILVLLAMAAGASSAEDGLTVAESGGRFSETPVGRKLLKIPSKLCCKDSAPNSNSDCRMLLPSANIPMCCKDIFGREACWDVGGYWMDKCGSCTTRCKFGEFCCRGVCTDPLNDKNNCGICGNRCHGPGGCKFGLCGY